MDNIKEYIRDDIWNAIEQHYKLGDYTEALRDASFLLKDILQKKSGEHDKDNAKLVDAVLSGQNPVLKINNFSSPTEKDMQNGIALGIKGIFMHVRNPISHEKIYFEKKDADAILLYIDYLVRQVDKSYGTSLIDEWLPLLEDDSFTNTKEYAEELIKELPKKKTFDLLLAIYEDRTNIAQYKTINFINLLVNRLTNAEKGAFIDKINIDLAQTHGGKELSCFFHFFGVEFFNSLKRVVRLRIEDIVYHGIKDASLVDGKTRGDNAAMATWANAFIKEFETKKKIQELLFKKAISSEEELNYVIKFFEEYVALDCEEILNNVGPNLKKRFLSCSGIYNFVRIFVFDKRSSIYAYFKEEIDQYEEEHLSVEDRIPDKLDIPF